MFENPILDAIWQACSLPEICRLRVEVLSRTTRTDQGVETHNEIDISYRLNMPGIAWSSPKRQDIMNRVYAAAQAAVPQGYVITVSESAR